MSTQNNLIIVTDSAKQREAQIYIKNLYKSWLNEIHKTKPSQIEPYRTKPNQTIQKYFDPFLLG
jgi:hypothetical protein